MKVKGYEDLVRTEALKLQALLSAVETVALPVISSFKITGCFKGLSCRR